MGYYVELRPATSERCRLEELEERLSRAGAEPHPGRGYEPRWEHAFVIPGGTVCLRRDEVLQEEWGTIRLSWGATREDWARLLRLVERIGGRIYDECVGDYVTRDTLDCAWESHQSGAA